jgi:hypothetical protein
MRLYLGLVAISLQVALGCSSSGTDSAGASEAGVDGSAPPPIDPSRKVTDLSDAERGALCDWYASVLGGYGHETSCAGGTTVQNYVDRATCVAMFFKPACHETVEEFETCINAEIPTQFCVLQFDKCMRVVSC